MKRAVYFLLVLTSLAASAQKKRYDCASINKYVIDTTLFKKVDGRFLLRGDLKVDLYEITTSTKGIYYVSRSFMRDIKSSIRANKCEGITIKKVKSDPTRKIVRD